MADFANAYNPGRTTTAAAPEDPNDQPNPANPGGVSNNQLARQRAAVPTAPAPTVAGFQPRQANTDTRTPEQKAQAAYQAGNTGGTATAYNAGSDATRATFDQAHATTQAVGIGRLPGEIAKYVGNARVDLNPMHVGPPGAVQNPKTGPAPGPQYQAGVTPGTALPSAPTAPGAGGPVADPGAAAQAPADPNGVTSGNFVQADRTAYDAAAADLARSRDTFQSELNRLSGVDPFGNQAFLQKATDRAVAQAAGTAAMARGGAQAQAGALRGQQGVQSQLAARGIQEMEQQKAQDANASAGLRLTAAQGMANVANASAANEVSLINSQLSAAETNLKGYLGGQELGQKERDSLRGLATEMAKVDMARYQTDMAYRQNVDDNIIAKYTSDNALKGVMAQVNAGENISKGEFIMGLLGAGAGVAQGIAMKSDRRSKYALRAPKLAELKEYLGGTKGSHYRYRQPDAPGQRHGDNFGPMAQDLAKTKIGRTVVVQKADGLYVDTGRLALADHGALSALAARVERLARKLGGSK